MGRNIDELIFRPCAGIENTEEATLTLSNGYTVKVLKGLHAIHTYGAPYELSVSPIIKEITEDSIGYLSEKELIRLINEIENFPKLRSHR
jgi:hypothetical protein